MGSLISIIIPCYNSSTYLAETLDNVLSLSYSDFECIIIDDGSTDETKSIADKYVTIDKRFQYYYQENSGSAAARNTGIKFSKGEFFQFLDADDLIHPNKLKLQVDYLMANQSVDIVFGQVLLFNNTAEIDFATVKDYENNLTKRLSGKDEEVLTFLIKNCIMAIHSPLLRKGVIEKAGMFDPSFKSCEDYELWFRATLAHLNFHYYNNPETTCYYRRHTNNKSSSGSRINYYSSLVKLTHLQRVKEAYATLYPFLLNELLLNHKKYLFLKNGKHFSDIRYTFKLALKYKSIRFLFVIIQYLSIPNRIWNLVYWNGGLINYLKTKIKNAK